MYYFRLFFASIFITLGVGSLDSQNLYIDILGVAQDAGYPQANCARECCRTLQEKGQKGAKVSCIGIVDETNQQSWMLDATPDFPQQLELLKKHGELSGIFLTHAHIGHYTGLMYLGREAMGANEVPVYVMPQMKQFISKNGPWSQLVQLNNITLYSLRADSTIRLASGLQITPFLVPHRDEFSETVGYLIEGEKKAVYIPDIDKWHLWERDIVALIKEVDYALLDATFYANGEIPNRDMSEIPHPFVEESLQLFQSLSTAEKEKIYFIHFNHTNPLLRKNSLAKQKVKSLGFHVAEEGLRLKI
ncbi:MAG: MBL fold metallo-hydrolase [Chitinophagales bacterium]|nr:MBL fold metallo-hydrolase [Chitinophagales bacterium]